MRLALYNQMFAFNGKSFFSNLAAHWTVHFQSKKEKVWEKMNIGRTLEIVKKSNADIIGICEIVEGQEKELKIGLKKLGYNYVYFGEGHRTKFNKLMIQVAIASKFRLTKIEVKDFPKINELGGGGGIIHCYCPKLKLHVFNIHFAIMQKKELQQNQMNFLKKYLSKINKNTILMGDFNQSSSNINFPGMNLVSDGIKTCSLTPIFRNFHFQDDDHIFVKGLKKTNLGFIEGYSDHRLIYVDLE